MVRGGTWAWVDRVLMVISIIIGLLTSGAMAWFTSIENAPWPVIILVSSTAFFLAGAGTLAFSLAVRHHINPNRVAHAHLSLRGALWDFIESENVTSITDNGVGHITLTWDKPFADSQYHVTVEPNGCFAQVENKTQHAVTLFFLAPTGTPTDPPTINLRAVGRRDNWWRLD